MADQKWTDWRELQSVLSNLDTATQNVKILVDHLETIKVAVLDNQARKDALKLLVDLDPDWSMAQLQALYVKYRAIGDWLESNG
jgi:hypothetical protein